MEMSEADKKELGLESNIDRLIVESYKLLGLMNYFTTGEDETRAWTIKQNSTVPQAGAAIHTDFKEKFIRAGSDKLARFAGVRFLSQSPRKRPGANGRERVCR